MIYFFSTTVGYYPTVAFSVLLSRKAVVTNDARRESVVCLKDSVFKYALHVHSTLVPGTKFCAVLCASANHHQPSSSIPGHKT